jgi:hypothetical protein
MKVVNPFDLLKQDKPDSLASQSSDGLVSESTVINDDPSVCPKCRAPMDTKQIRTPDFKGLEPVFWCNSCRVTTPKPL